MHLISHLRGLRLVAAAVLAIAAMATMAALAGAAPIEKTSFMVAECDAVPLDPGEWSFVGQENMHMRGMSNLYTAYVREGSAWRQIGTVTTHPNANLNSNATTIWGTFEYTDDGTIGTFTGSFNWSMGNNGRASGRSADGTLVKITLGVDPTPYLPLPTPNCDVREYDVMSPQG